MTVSMEKMLEWHVQVSHRKHLITIVVVVVVAVVVLPAVVLSMIVISTFSLSIS